MKSKQKGTQVDSGQSNPKEVEGEFKRALTKHWKAYDRAYMLKLFEEDSKRFKLRNVIQAKDLADMLARFRDKYYDKYLLVFLEMQALSQLWPLVSWHQIHCLFQTLGIYNETFTSSLISSYIHTSCVPPSLTSGNIDALFRESTVPETVNDSRVANTSPQGMLRFEFMEFVMRVAIDRYFLSLQVSDVGESLDLLFAACAKSFRGDFARLGPGMREKKLLGDPRLLRVIEERYSDLQLTFALLKEGGESLPLKRLVGFLDESELVLSEHTVWRAMALSKLPVADEMKSEGYRSLEVVEFVEVLCRLCLEEFSLRHLDEVSRLERKLDCLLGNSL